MTDRYILDDDPSLSEPTQDVANTCLDSPSISPAEDGSDKNEEERLLRVLTEIQTTCERFQLPGKPNHALTTEREDLRWKSYVCIGGKFGLKKHDCWVYSFG
jgi:hypothetical protein